MENNNKQGSWFNFWGLNPKVKDFIENNGEVTLIGLQWASIWRIYLLIFGSAFAVGFIAKVIGWVFGSNY